MIKPNNFGMAVARDGKSMQDSYWKNTTQNKKWTVDLDKTPPHLQVFEQRGGTKFVLRSDEVHYVEEVLFRMKHGMPFKPKFLCFFYTVDAPAQFSAAIGGYTQNHGFMLYNAIGLGEEGVYAKITDDEFQIIHFAETFGWGDPGVNTTFFGSDYLFRIRFELLNQQAFYIGDKGY